MHLQESGEMYLETVLVLSKKNTVVRSIDVAEHMGVTKPSVSRAVGLLRDGGYLLMDKSGYLSLTPLGEEIATKVYDRHRILTDFFIRLGVSAAVASEDACKIEHHISDETITALKKYLETLK